MSSDEKRSTASAEDLRDAAFVFVSAWDRAESSRGCYSCAEAHDCRCEKDRNIKPYLCTCGRDALEIAADRLRAALAAPAQPTAEPMLCSICRQVHGMEIIHECE
jgi:hypothetical protein